MDDPDMRYETERVIDIHVYDSLEKKSEENRK